MVSPFEIVIQRWAELGFFQFLFPFMLSSAIFYGLLRKSKIMGERSEVVNAVIALVASFMIWAYPIIIGIDITQALTAFFMQGLVVGLFAMIGILVASMFHPNIQEFFKENYKWANLIIIAVFVIIGAVLVFTSGLWQVFGGPSLTQMRPETLEIVLSVIILFLMLGTLVFIARPSAPERTE